MSILKFKDPQAFCMVHKISAPLLIAFFNIITKNSNGFKKWLYSSRAQKKLVKFKTIFRYSAKANDAYL